jgi:hypothetical protein
MLLRQAMLLQPKDAVDGIAGDVRNDTLGRVDPQSTISMHQTEESN